MEANGTRKNTSSIIQPLSERTRGDASSDTNLAKNNVRGGGSFRRKARRFTPAAGIHPPRRLFNWREAIREHSLEKKSNEPIKLERSESERGIESTSTAAASTRGEETSTSPVNTRESTNDEGATSADTQSEPTPVSTPRSANGGGRGGGGGEGSEWGVPIGSPTKTASIDNSFTSTTATSTSNSSSEAKLCIAPLSEWNPISDNVSVNNNSPQPDESGYDSDASTVVWTDPNLLNATLDEFNNDFENILEDEVEEPTSFDSTTKKRLLPNDEAHLDNLSRRTKPVLDDPPPSKKIKLEGFDRSVSTPPSIGCINPCVIKDRLIFFNIALSDPSIHKYAIPLRDNGSTLYVGISAKSEPPKTYFTERNETDQNMSVCFSSLNTLEHFYDVCKNFIETGDPFSSWKKQKLDVPNSEIDFSMGDGVLRMIVKNSISGKHHKQFLLTLEMMKQFVSNFWKLEDFVKFLKLRSDIITYGESILLSSDKEMSKQEFCELFLAGNQPNYVLNVGEIWKILESKYTL